MSDSILNRLPRELFEDFESQADRISGIARDIEGVCEARFDDGTPEARRMFDLLDESLPHLRELQRIFRIVSTLPPDP